MRPWSALIQPDDIDVVAPDGTVRSRVKGYYSGKQIIIDDMSVDVQPGDEIRRLLPNGKEEAFVVDDPKFYKGGHFGSHYQVSISRRREFDPKTGGNYNIHVTGPNARVSIGSQDHSINVVAGDVFGDIATALRGAVKDRDELQRLLSAVDEMKQKRGSDRFEGAYTNFVTMAAKYLAPLAPSA
jgi:hypothetical protein